MLSIPHLIVIFVVALVVFGPEKLPDLARNLGKLMGEFRRATGDLRTTFEGHLRDLERETEQRRIASSAGPITPPPEPYLPPAAGTIPATAPRAVATDTGGEHPSGSPAPIPDTLPESSRTEDSEVTKSQSTHDPEIVSDGSHHPA
jgi:sec-independent protein translocase protein TatB